jgi:hypothetical protein
MLCSKVSIFADWQNNAGGSSDPLLCASDETPEWI